MQIPSPSNSHYVTGGEGVRIAVQEWGHQEGAPIVFVHAFSQSHLSWLPQVTGPLARDHRLITFDNRGHGNSDKPQDMEAYKNGGLFADDLNAVLKSLLPGPAPIVVAWSIGGVLVNDYLAKYGDGALSGLLYVGAAHVLDRNATHFGSAFVEYGPGMMSPDLATNASATIAAVKAITTSSVDPDLLTFIVATNMVVPNHVRAAMASREVDHFINTLPSVSIPVRLLHGKADNIVSPTSAVAAHDVIPQASITLLDGVGHAPGVENPAALEAEIRVLTKSR